MEGLSTRQLKVGREIQRDLAEIIRSKGMAAFDGALLTVSEVRISPDLSIAKVYVSIFPSAKQQKVLELLEEEKKAVSIVKREDYDTDDDYARAIEAIDDHWWTISQPQLDMRNANDAILEMLAKYKLNE